MLCDSSGFLHIIYVGRGRAIQWLVRSVCSTLRTISRPVTMDLRGRGDVVVVGGSRLRKNPSICPLFKFSDLSCSYDGDLESRECGSFGGRSDQSREARSGTRAVNQIRVDRRRGRGGFRRAFGGRRRFTFSESEMIGLCRRRDLSGLAAFVKSYRGTCVLLPWPSNCDLKLGDVGTVSGFSLTDLRRCETQFLGETVEMQVVGSVRRNGKEYPVMVGSDGYVYGYDDRDDALYQLADGLTDFLELGMMRFEPMYATQEDLEDACGRTTGTAQMCRSSERLRYVLSLTDFGGLLGCLDTRERTAYVSANRGLALRLTWPENMYVILTDSKGAGVTALELTRIQNEMSIPEPLMLLGVVADAKNDFVVRGLWILVSDSGRVFAYSESAKTLLEIADRVQTFVRVGLSRMVDDYKYENVGSAALETAMCFRHSDNTRLPPKKRKMVIQPFDSFDNLYDRYGRTKFDPRWKSLMEICQDAYGRCGDRYKTRVKKFVTENAGAWLAMVWPPRYGLAVGSVEHFRDGAGMKNYKRFACTANVRCLMLIGVVCEYGTAPDGADCPEILISETGCVFCYIDSENRMYAISETIDGFVSSGLGVVYSFFERDFDDAGTERAWYGYDTGRVADLLRLGKNYEDVLSYCAAKSGMCAAVGGMVRCSLTFGTRCTLRKHHVNGFVLDGLDLAGFHVIGQLDYLDRTIVIDRSCGVYAILHGSRMVKLANDLRAFFRWGATWFKCMRKLCFAPKDGAGVVGDQRWSCPNLSECVLPGDTFCFHKIDYLNRHSLAEDHPVSDVVPSA
ncbi:B29 [miniopterid betaherpesvirus 1]|uniref:B29 n=1 Tax=miniopterid betaherpesvirus 1 TaxID=3070189 RepID=I3VQ01_9BETA|nr:B29 [miniopterid betaherpesvirus 1]AFK83845.1 B29 [miniopterid betaherpesvirus 1]